jgi:hypothetical protein
LASQWPAKTAKDWQNNKYRICFGGMQRERNCYVDVEFEAGTPERLPTIAEFVQHLEETLEGGLVVDSAIGRKYGIVVVVAAYPDPPPLAVPG